MSVIMELDGDTLGKKHKHYNKILKETLEKKQEFDSDSKNDIECLMKIDTACYNKNVEYVLCLLKSPDILHVIRVLEKSVWLITDPQYSNIINPNYLENVLFPDMTSKAKTKLMKSIKLHLKDETRVEEFYKKETNPKLAMKWLPNCSVTFIEDNIDKHSDHIKVKILNRLCKKSFTIFEKFMKTSPRLSNNDIFNATVFLLNNHTEKYFGAISQMFGHYRPKFNAKKTEILMKHIPDQIIDNFPKHCRYIDIITFVNYIKRENVKSLLLKLANEKECDSNKRWFHNYNSVFFKYETIKLFIKRMPIEEQFDFVKEVFIDKIHEKISEQSVVTNSEMMGKIRLSQNVNKKTYYWYELAPFDFAFEQLTTHMLEYPLEEKYIILSILLKCLNHNQQNIKTLLQYYSDKHAKDSIGYKRSFLKSLFESTDIHKYEEATWGIVNEIFNTMNVYKPKEDYVDDDLTVCVEALVVYKVIHGETVDDVILDKLQFNTFKYLKSKLENEKKDILFDFLLKYFFKKIDIHDVQSEEDFNIVVNMVEDILNLLLAWNKELNDFPMVYNKIKKLAKIKDDNSWKKSLLSLYNKNKSWRKLMFEESFILHPSEDVCLNALKHDPQLLNRYNEKVEKLRNTISLTKVNRKLRIYWPQTLSSEWGSAYYKSLDNVEYHKPVLRGIFTLQLQSPLVDIVTKYIPKEAKINWSETNEMELSMQRHIAKTMHIARPQLGPDMVLGYAKGDYLQYALPSLIATFYNLKTSESREFIMKLLNAPVSLQKHGIRFVFMKLKTEEIKEICTDVWNNSKNATLRKVLFEFTHNLLCKGKDENKAKIVWELLDKLIDNLTYKEDPSLYKLLPNINEIHVSVKGLYFVKVYKFLQCLIKNSDKEKKEYEHYKEKLISSTRGIIEQIDPDFVCELILELLDEKFYSIENKYSLQNANFGVITILSAFLLYLKDTDIQRQRCEKLLMPLLRKSFALWHEPEKTFIHTHIAELLNRFTMDLNKIVFDKKCIIPLDMFLDIQSELKKSLILSQNYALITKWNLTIQFTKMMKEDKNVEYENWDKLCADFAPVYGEMCGEYLKREVETLFPRIYVLFSKALRNNTDILFDYETRPQVFKGLFFDQNFIPGYLCGISLLHNLYYSDKNKELEFIKLVLMHPSIEVKMHYHTLWDKNPLMMEEIVPY